MSQVWLRAPTPDDPSSVTTVNPFGEPAPSPVPITTPGSPTSSTLTPFQQDGLAYLTNLLDSYGLGSLAGWAHERLVAGDSPEMIRQQLYDRPEFKARFPVIEARRKAGLPPMSVDEILAYEKSAKQLFHRSGLPLGFYDSTAQLQQFMIDDVSLSELSTRVQLATQDFFSTDSLARDELSRLYGLTPGQHLAYILDPDTAIPLIERQFTAAKLSATSIRTTYGQLSQAEAESLAGVGVTESQATQGFSALASSRPLFTSLPGEAANPDISREEQLGALFFQDAVAQERLRRRQQLRLSAYRGGGTFAGTQSGIVGLGSNVT